MSKVIRGFNPIKGGWYYRWGRFGMPYYVSDYGESGARKRAYQDGKLERLTDSHVSKTDETKEKWENRRW